MPTAERRNYDNRVSKLNTADRLLHDYAQWFDSMSGPAQEFHKGYFTNAWLRKVRAYLATVMPDKKTEEHHEEHEPVEMGAPFEM